MPSQDPWDTYRDGFLAAYFAANPAFAVSEGKHEFDGVLPDWSEEGLRGQIRWLHGARDSVAGFDSATLGESQGFERDYLLAVIDRDLFWMERAEAPWRNPDYYVSFSSGGIAPDIYLRRPYAPLPERMRAYIKWARSVPRAAAQIRANLRTPIPGTFIAIGHTRFGGLASYLRQDVPDVFAEVADTALQAELRTANAVAAQSFADLDAWLLAQRPQATDDFALGPDLFQEMLWATERVSLPLDQLEQIGRQDLERNLQALREACAAFAPGRSIRQCVDRMVAHKPPGGAVAAARLQLDTLETFLRSTDLVSIPGTERALVEESPPHQRSNFAYIDIPGPYEHDLPSVYYIAPPDSSWPAAEQAAYVPGAADLLFTSVHEVWPGHFLQFLHANRVSSEIGRDFVGYAYAEGWAHYAEELMWEVGVGGGTPETHLGQLSNALLRNVRFLSAIGLHTGRMTVAQSERLFWESAFQDAATARQQALRGTYDPAYLNYTLGKLMIRRLREDWTKNRGGRAAWRQFHDTFLSYGGPPIPLVRRAMLGSDEGPLF